MNETRLAYLAGLFDGEGSFSIQVMDKEYGLNFAPKMTLSVKCEEPLTMLVDTFGGRIYGGARWSLGTRADIEKAALMLEPYLVIKRDICNRFLYALSLFPENSRKGVALHNGERGWTRELEFEVAQIAYTLNQVKGGQERLDNLCARYGVDATITLPGGHVNVEG